MPWTTTSPFVMMPIDSGPRHRWWRPRRPAWTRTSATSPAIARAASGPTGPEARISASEVAAVRSHAM